MLQQPLRHLAASGIAGAEEENSLTFSHCHLAIPSARFLRIPCSLTGVALAPLCRCHRAKAEPA
jgi:hypothetical protein